MGGGQTCTGRRTRWCNDGEFLATYLARGHGAHHSMSEIYCHLSLFHSRCGKCYLPFHSVQEIRYAAPFGMSCEAFTSHSSAHDPNKTQEPIHSPHASPISTPRAKSTDGDVFTASSSDGDHPKPVKVAAHVVVAIIKWTLCVKLPPW